MNYNRGCYNRPSAQNYRTRAMQTAEENRLRTSCVAREQYDIFETKEQNYTLAMVYSPYQEWQNIYNGEKALENGTIFAELDKPFLGYKYTKGTGCL